MVNDVKRASRLAKVLGNVDRLQRARLSEIEKARASCAAEQLEILNIFQNDDAQYGQFVGLLARRIKALTVKATALDAQYAAQESNVRKSAVRRKAADNLLEDSRDQAMLDAEVQSFKESLELLALQGRGKSTRSS